MSRLFRHAYFSTENENLGTPIDSRVHTSKAPGNAAEVLTVPRDGLCEEISSASAWPSKARVSADRTYFGILTPS